MTTAGVLTRLYPDIGPWTERVLWSGHADFPQPSADLFETEVPSMVRKRLVGLAVEAAPEGSPTSLLAEMRKAAFAAATFTIQVTNAGARVCDELEIAGFDPVVVKGPALARFWATPGHRTYGDLDLYVPASQFDEALAHLRDTGYEERIESALPWAVLETHCREGLNLQRSPVERIDLHHQVPPWLWAEGLTRQLLASPRERMSAAGGQIPVASAELNFLVASLHLVSDRGQPGETLIIWRDLVELSRAVDMVRLADLAGECGLGGWVRAVVSALPFKTSLHDHFDLFADQPVAHRHRLAWVAHRRQNPERLPFDVLLRLPTPRAALYGAGILFPSPTHLRQRYGGVATGLRQWWFGSGSSP